MGIAARLATLVPDTDTHTLPPAAAKDLADEAMCERARERYAGDRKSRWRRRRKRHAQLPNLIIIGGLKCGTTSIHHYLGLHPEVQMSKPKELNFFVEELNWALGLDWYASRFDDRFKVRGESSPHYTNQPRFDGVAERIKQHCPDAKLLYMVRDQITLIAQEELHAEREATMRKAFAFAGVDESFVSEQFDREWEKSSAK